MSKTILVLVAAGAAVAVAPARAEGLRLDLDASYSVANPDYSPFPNGEGVSIYGQLVYQDALLLLARYNDASFRPSGPAAGGIVESWSELGLGYRWRWSAAWASELLLTAQRVENTQYSESGWQVQLGARLQALEALSFAAHFGYLDVLLDDFTMTFEAKHQFHERVYAVARLRDYADWDFTYYEVGLGLRF